MQVSEFMKQFMATHKDFRIVEVVSGFCESHGPYTNNRVVQTFEDGTENELPLLGCPECRNEDSIREGVEMMKDSRVGLRIEEIGRFSWAEHESQTLYEIIDYRSMNGKKTIIAGNLTTEEFMGKYDDSFKRKLGAILCS